MKKNILVIILLVVILTLIFTIIKLQKRPRTTISQPVEIFEETKESPREQVSATDTEFLRYGIRPREAKYYE